MNPISEDDTDAGFDQLALWSIRKDKVVESYRDLIDPSSRIPTRALTSSQHLHLECHLRGLQELSEVVVCNPRIKGGVPVMRGTRFTASQVIAEIADSDAVSELCENLSLSQDDVTGLLNGISMLLMRPR